MKKTALVFSIAFFLIACSNEADTNTSKDTSNTTIAPDNTINADTSNRIKDTSSYERMPQKSSDTVPQ